MVDVSICQHVAAVVDVREVAVAQVIASVPIHICRSLKVVSPV